MCGIAGFTGGGDQELLKRMTNQLAHRGPDGEGLWSDSDAGIYLGHRRLSIVDLAQGAQPMWTSDNQLGIVFNGEIYNHRELRKALESSGHIFTTDHCDTEVLLYGYREWGSDLPDRLNGMWAFVIYDKARRKLFGSRDRFGQKPFYYHHNDRVLVFGSELHAVTLHPGVSTNISILSLQKYFGYGYIPAPNTIYNSVAKLPAGHNLEFDLSTGELELQQFWDFELDPLEEGSGKTLETWCEELRHLLQQAVERRLMSDVPLGTFLSGGIDSSAVSAFAANKLGPGKLQTYSIGFKEADFDESGYAMQVAEHISSSHNLKILDSELSHQLIPEIIGMLDEPLGDASLLPTYLLCKHTRKNVTVALGGDGADELFAGYDPFRAIKLARWYSSIIPKPVHAGIQYLFAKLPVSHSYMSWDFRVKRTLRGLDYPSQLWAPVWMATLDPNDINEMFRQQIDVHELFSEAVIAWESCKESDLMSRLLQFYTKLYLQDDILTKVDRASMMVSLEARSPFLDIDFVNFVRRIPTSYKYRNGQTKFLLKKALEPVLPHNILYRSKQGFGVPIGKWFQQHKIELRTPQPDPFSNQRDFVQHRLQEHLNNKIDQRAFLWNQSVLDRWSDNQKLQ